MKRVLLDLLELVGWTALCLVVGYILLALAMGWRP